MTLLLEAAERERKAKQQARARRRPTSGFTGNDGYALESNAIVSADGSSAEGLGPVALKTGIHDYGGSTDRWLRALIVELFAE